MSMCVYFPDIELRVATTIEELKKLENWFGVFFDEPTKDGSTYFYDKKGSECLIVYLGHTDVSDPSVAALAAHEAVHCMQFYMHSIGEVKPSTEFEAYAVQSFTHEILDRVSKVVS